MKKTMLIGLMAGVLLATSAWAETAQQARMKSCNAEASSKQMKGDARQAFMKSCLSGDAKSAGKATTTQQQRMKDCNAEASSKQMKGDARQGFMKSCLSGKKAAERLGRCERRLREEPLSFVGGGSMRAMRAGWDIFCN